MDDLSSTACITKSRGGDTAELRPAVFHLVNPRLRWVVSKQPAMNPAFALAEVLWIVSGRNDTEFLEHWFPNYGKFVGGSGVQPGAYGERLRIRFDIDQLQVAAESLSANPESRQVVIQIWDPTSDLPSSDGQPQNGDIPCNVAGCLKVRDGKLHWLQLMRSNDADRGFPHNLVQFTMLQEILAGWIGVEIGEYTHIADSFHCYTDDRACHVRDDLTPAKPGPSLQMKSEDFQSELAIVLKWLEELREKNPTRIDQVTASMSLSPAFENIRLVLLADHLRARGDRSGAASSMHKCQDEAYRQMWNLWVDRLSSNRAASPS